MSSKSVDVNAATTAKVRFEDVEKHINLKIFVSIQVKRRARSVSTRNDIHMAFLWTTPGRVKRSQVMLTWESTKRTIRVQNSG